MPSFVFYFVQVTGFSVGGRVVDGNDVGVEGVKIIVDGHERSITDREGYYKLDQVFMLSVTKFLYVLFRHNSELTEL